MKELNDPHDVSSHCRYIRTQELLKVHSGKLTTDLMKRFSQDHMNGPGPNSIGRHGQHYSEETSQSSVVVGIDANSLTKTRMWAAFGKPCQAWTHPDGSIERAQDDSGWHT